MNDEVVRFILLISNSCLCDFNFYIIHVSLLFSSIVYLRMFGYGFS